MKFNLAHYFQETCRANPEKVGLVGNDREYTYGELWRWSVAVAHGLAEQGVRSGDRVLLAKESGAAMIASFWGIQLAGATVATYSHRNPIEKILFTITNAEPKLAILDDDVPEANAPALCETKVSIWKASRVEGMRASASALNGPVDLSSVISEDIASIIYTSGSTGDPKGVVLTHGNMTAALLSITTYLGMSSRDVVVSALPLTFDYGLYQMLMSFALGATLVLEEATIWPAGLLKKAEACGATILPVVPTMVVAFGAFQSTLKLDLSTVRIVTSTAERFKEGNFKIVSEMFPNARMFSMYGLTECKRCTYVPPERLGEKKGSVGKAIPNTEIRIINEEGEFLPPRQEGELVIRGSTVMRGYWKMSEKTARAFHFDELGNKWLRSGDFGYLDEDGFFFLQGRRDAVVKVRGMKVSTNEVEEVLARSELVHEAGIVVQNEPDRPTSLIAFIAPRSECAPADILKYARKNLQPFEVPAQVRILPSLPKSINGKIDRKALALLLTEAV